MAALFEKPAFLVLLLIVLLLFGANKLPELARGLGRSIRVFKVETRELSHHSAGDGSLAEGPHDPAHGHQPGDGVRGARHPELRSEGSVVPTGNGATSRNEPSLDRP
jgi:sec-independent protein translocase protein TatA